MPNSRATILVVDDDPRIRKLLRNCYEAESYTVFEASTGQEMFSILEQSSVDLITLDLNLDGEDGLELARQLSASTAISIIIVSGKGELIDKVLGLELGADDYVSKPFELREVLARTKSVLRRASQTKLLGLHSRNSTGSSELFSFADWQMCPSKRVVRDLDGVECELTTAEFDLLELLVRNPQQVLSRDHIMDSLKGNDWNPTDRTIDNQVARLRKKIQRNDINPLIKTIRGVGYLFSADVFHGKAGDCDIA